MSKNFKKPVYFQDKNPYNPYNFRVTKYKNPYILATLYVAQWNIVQIVPFLKLFYTLLLNPLKNQTTPLIIKVHFDP